MGNAALEGAAAAVELCLHMAGVLCLWSGVMGVMRACGLAQGGNEMNSDEHKKVIYVATVCIIGAIIICCIPYLFHLFLN